jgi:hypothetical protein
MKITVDTKVGELIPEGDNCFNRNKGGSLVNDDCPFLRFDTNCMCQLLKVPVSYNYDENVCKKRKSCPKPPVEETK